MFSEDWLAAPMGFAGGAAGAGGDGAEFFRRVVHVAGARAERGDNVVHAGAETGDHLFEHALAVGLARALRPGLALQPGARLGVLAKHLHGAGHVADFIGGVEALEVERGFAPR